MSKIIKATRAQKLAHNGPGRLYGTIKHGKIEATIELFMPEKTGKLEDMKWSYLVTLPTGWGFDHKEGRNAVVFDTLADVIQDFGYACICARPRAGAYTTSPTNKRAPLRGTKK